jgi:hypothetical protein
VNACSSLRATSLKFLPWIDPRAALGHFVQLADRLVRREVGADGCVHDLLGARDSSWQGHDAHPADQAVEGDELLYLWLVAQDRTTITLSMLRR